MFGLKGISVEIASPTNSSITPTIGGLTAARPSGATDHESPTNPKGSGEDTVSGAKVFGYFL
jgi:hypothetical protein